jgi:predicted nucleotidyltransferase
MIDTISSQLKMIEESYQVRILYALESGSRAWGFASLDSDYDVRFLYVHPVEWYLSIRDQRDVIEIPITDSLDINGWDLKKALKLFCKSNSPLLEWLRSPIVYRDVEGLAESLRNLIPTCFSPKNGMYHYLHMAKGNFREYLQVKASGLKNISMCCAQFWHVNGLRDMAPCRHRLSSENW